MAESSELRGRIDEAKKYVDRALARSLKQVRKLKEEAYRLELNISMKKERPTARDTEELWSATDRLDRFSDLLIKQTKTSWELYESLTRDCETVNFSSPELDNLRVSCKRMEQFAADLLCYSLGRSKRKDAASKLS